MSTTRDTTTVAGHLPWFVKVVHWIALKSAMVAGLLTGLMGANIILDVLGRTLFRQPLPATVDITQYFWMPGLALLALGVTELSGQHIRVSILPEALTKFGTRISDIVASIAVAGLIGWLSVLSWEKALGAVEIHEVSGATGFPIWPGRILVAAGLTVLTVSALARIYQLSWTWTQARPAGKERGVK